MHSQITPADFPRQGRRKPGSDFVGGCLLPKSKPDPSTLEPEVEQADIRGLRDRRNSPPISPSAYQNLIVALFEQLVVPPARHTL